MFNWKFIDKEKFSTDTYTFCTIPDVININTWGYFIFDSECNYWYFINIFFLRPQGVNFINVKRANFSYKCWFQQLFSSYMYVAKTTFVRKICNNLYVM